MNDFLENWTPEKEKEYQKQLSELRQKEDKKRAKTNNKEISITGELLNTVQKNCSICGKFSIDSSDDVYLERYNCCERCYLDNDWKLGR
jgi:hypothetical protein